MAKYDPIPPLDNPKVRRQLCICHWLHPPAPGLLGSWNTSSYPHPTPRRSRALSSEPPTSWSLSPWAPVPGTGRFPCLCRMTLPWPRAQPLPRSPAGILMEHRAGLTEAVANGTQAHTLPWTRCPSPTSGCSPLAVLLPFCPGNSQFPWFVSFLFPQGGIQIFRKQPRCTNSSEQVPRDPLWFRYGRLDYVYLDSMGRLHSGTGVFQCFSPGRFLPVDICPKSLPPFRERSWALPVSCKLTEASVAFSRSPGALEALETHPPHRKGRGWRANPTAIFPCRFPFHRALAGAPFGEESHHAAQAADSRFCCPASQTFLQGLAL